MSSGERLAGLAAVLLLTACGSPPPGSVDLETVIELRPCILREASCVQSGPVDVTETLVPGANQSLSMKKGARISLPLTRPSPTAKLKFIAVGLRAYGTDAGSFDPTGARRLALAVSGKTVELASIVGYSRVEAGFGDMIPAADARIELTAVEGTSELVYLVARWNE